MKKTVKSLIAAALAVCCITPLVACGGGEMLTTKPNTGISAGVDSSVKSYAPLAYYELENPSDVEISFRAKEIQKVSFKYRVLEDDEYDFDDNVLTVKKSVFAGETAGDKRLRVFVGNKYVEISVRVVTKVIYTTTDFNNIRNNMNGVYVLGADIDFGGAAFFPIGKSLDGGSSSTFEGIFDGMGHSIKNLAIYAHDNSLGEDGAGQGPSLGNEVENGRNYNNGIFMSTGGSAQIINTNFINIKVVCQGLGGTIAGANGGLIKNCFVTCSLSTYGDMERAGGICAINGSSDAAGRIENCVVVYENAHGGQVRGIADWNNGIIKNCYAANVNDYVLHVAYDSETGAIPDDFDYDDLFNSQNFNDLGFGWFTLPAFPGSAAWGDGPGGKIYYKAGDIINSDVVRKEFLCDPDNFPEEDGWDRGVWNFTYGGFPTLKIQSK